MPKCVGRKLLTSIENNFEILQQNFMHKNKTKGNKNWRLKSWREE